MEVFGTLCKLSLREVELGGGGEYRLCLCRRPPVHFTCVHQVLVLRLHDLLELTWEGLLSCGMGEWLAAALPGASQNHFWVGVLATLRLFHLCLPWTWSQLFHVAGSYPLVREETGRKELIIRALLET